MKRKITIILVIGILIRLFLAFSTFHPDLQVFYYAGEVIAKGNILNFYDYLRNLPPGDPILTIYPTNLFIYPPLFYFFFGPVSHLLSSPFSYNILHNFIFGLSMVLGNLQLNLFLLAIKLPYLAFDLGIAFLLFRLFEKPKNKLLAFTLWIFNPINLYATYMMGQFDVIPTFLTVLALFLAVKKEKYFYSALFLWLGASFKIFPVLLLVPLALVRKKWIERLIIIAIGAGTDVAIEAADITMVSKDLNSVAGAIELSRKTMRTIRLNLFWAFGYNTILIPVAMGALFPFFHILLNPILASGAMALSSVSVVTNSLLLKRIKL